MAEYTIENGDIINLMGARVKVQDSQWTRDCDSFSEFDLDYTTIILRGHNIRPKPKTEIEILKERVAKLEKALAFPRAYGG